MAARAAGPAMLPFDQESYEEEMACTDHIRVVSLIGNAGHGKTALCRRLQERFGVAPKAEGSQAVGLRPADAEAGGTQRVQAHALQGGGQPEDHRRHSRAPSISLRRRQGSAVGNQHGVEAALAQATILSNPRGSGTPGTRVSRANSAREPSKDAGHHPEGPHGPLTYLLDTPGHADFAAHAAAALRLADGALLVLDVGEGLLAHGRALLRQTLAERVRPALFINGLDRCIWDYRMSVEDLEVQIRKVVDDVNAAIAAQPDELLGDLALRAGRGQVALGCATQGWALTIPRVAKHYASRYGLTPEAVAEMIWDPDGKLPARRASRLLGQEEVGAQSLSRLLPRSMTVPSSALVGPQSLSVNGPRSRRSPFGSPRASPRQSVSSTGGFSALKVPQEQELQDAIADRYERYTPEECVSEDPGSPGQSLLARLVLEPLRQLTCSLMEGDLETAVPVLTSWGVELSAAEKELKGEELVACALRKWMSAPDVALELVQTHLPSPCAAQKYRAESLYRGLPDDEAAVGLRSCSPKAPLLAFVSCLLPGEAGGGQAYGLGRVFSGRLPARKAVQVHCASGQRLPGEPARVVREVELLAAPMGERAEPLGDEASVPCGNLFVISGPEQFLLKAGTLTDSEGAAAIVPLPRAEPLVRAAVKPGRPEELPELQGALRWLRQVEPACTSSAEEWGEHVVAGAGERHLDACLALLSERLSPLSLSLSTPGGSLPGSRFSVAYQETVASASSAPSRLEAPGGHWRLEATAAPLGERLCADLEEGLVGLSLGAAERASVLANRYGWGQDDGLHVWCFGPGDGCGSNVVVDAGAGAEAVGVGRDGCAGDLRSSMVAACRWAASEGALCEEPLRGVRFSLSAAAAPGAAAAAGGARCGSGSLVSPARRGLLAAELAAEPGLQEPWVWAEVLCQTQSPETTAEQLRDLLQRRQARVLEEFAGGPGGVVRLLAELPAVRALGLDEALQEPFAGRCRLQAGLGCWTSLPGSAVAETGRHREVVLSLRRWRQLREAPPNAEAFLAEGAKASSDAVFSDPLLDVLPACLRRESPAGLGGALDGG